MTFDLTEMLQDWDYKPGQVVARRFQGKDGEKIQLRVDLGILQMNVLGRPDGKSRWGMSPGSISTGSVLNRPRPAPIARILILPWGRRNAGVSNRNPSSITTDTFVFQLKDYEAVERDCIRNLEVFSFVDRFAESDDLSWSVVQFTPQLTMMRTRARGEARLQESDRCRPHRHRGRHHRVG